jgi:hypothetical protein
METYLPAIRTSGENLRLQRLFRVFTAMQHSYHVCYFCGAVSTIDQHTLLTHNIKVLTASNTSKQQLKTFEDLPFICRTAIHFRQSLHTCC